MKIINFCDSCGKPFDGEPHPIVDEEYKEIEGLIQCEECYFQQLLGEEYKKIVKNGNKSHKRKS